MDAKFQLTMCPLPQVTSICFAGSVPLASPEEVFETVCEMLPDTYLGVCPMVKYGKVGTSWLAASHPITLAKDPWTPSTRVARVGHRGGLKVLCQRAIWECNREAPIEMAVLEDAEIYRLLIRHDTRFRPNGRRMEAVVERLVRLIDGVRSSFEVGLYRCYGELESVPHGPAGR